MFCIKCKKCDGIVLFDMFSFEKDLTMIMHGYCIDCEMSIKRKMTFTKLCELCGTPDGNSGFEKEMIANLFGDFSD